MRTSYFTYFSSGYGMCWLGCIIFALVSETHVDVGSFGLVGFPILALIYAGTRWSQDKRRLQLEAFGRER